MSGSPREEEEKKNKTANLESTLSLQSRLCWAFKRSPAQFGNANGGKGTDLKLTKGCPNSKSIRHRQNARNRCHETTQPAFFNCLSEKQTSADQASRPQRLPATSHSHSSPCALGQPRPHSASQSILPVLQKFPRPEPKVGTKTEDLRS